MGRVPRVPGSPALESLREDAQPRVRGDVLTAISEGLVSLIKDYYGKGPTEARTYWQDDLVVCVLRGGFTRVEATLAEGGRGEAVIHQRMAFQQVMRERFQAVIEAATGRRVFSFMSGNEQDPDMMCEVFVLAPSGVPSAPANPNADLGNGADGR